jgi:hypothetical protein
MFERAATGSGNAHHVAEGSEEHVMILRNGQSIIDSAHGQNANRAARPVNQFDVVGKYVLQPEAVNGVCVAAANLHEPVVPIGIGEPAYLVGGLCDQFRFTKFVYKFHSGSPSQTARTKLRQDGL